MYAHPDKFEKGRMGEDAFFLCEPGMGKLHNHAHQAFGVADGVGDWVFLRDVDSALYSQQLVKLCQQGFRDDPGSGPMKTLRQSYHQLKELETRGSSTICLANFDCWTGVLSIANLVGLDVSLLLIACIAWERTLHYEWSGDRLAHVYLSLIHI